MNPATNQAAADSRFGPTQNPQNIGPQTLGASSTNLQNGQESASQAPLTITSVGSSSFAPVDITTTSTTAPAPTPAAKNSTPVFVSVGLVVLVCAVAVWVMSKTAAKDLLKK